MNNGRYVKMREKNNVVCSGCSCSTCRERNAALVEALDILEEMLSDKLSDDFSKARDLLKRRGREV
jgi:queuine/archaeosine tRNA-ribosyltransferase